MASGSGTGDRGEISSKELSEDFSMKRRERRSKRKPQICTQLHGGRVELEFTDGSTSSVAVVENGPTMNDSWESNCT
jgi:probable phosphoglycerate mutase